MSDGIIKLTQEGLEKIKNELRELKTVRRKEVAGRIEVAKELGDLSENADYQAAKEESAWLEGRILELDNILSRSQVAEAPKAGIVSIGSTVTTQSNNQTRIFIIVGATEADPGHGKISAESPLGSALLGCKVDDDILVQTPGGAMRYKIVKVE
ncbi:MAG: Transcription elongation factor GreA [Parcubacteria group bacterium GW2011_GWC2_45_7]|nr:MAG: Transcription elongation factor GreA [Parcubacteria group bacterium GW2011_GWA2_42_28]KKU12598.1 MAG: Transcription elongation factor GreA [Parcubacteria group bacterium GW2011_GWC2_45_7]